MIQDIMSMKMRFCGHHQFVMSTFCPFFGHYTLQIEEFESMPDRMRDRYEP